MYTQVCVEVTAPAEVFLCRQFLFSMAQAKEVALLNVQSHDLLEELVQRLGGGGGRRKREKRGREILMCL